MARRKNKKETDYDRNKILQMVVSEGKKSIGRFYLRQLQLINRRIALCNKEYPGASLMIDQLITAQNAINSIINIIRDIDPEQVVMMLPGMSLYSLLKGQEEPEEQGESEAEPVEKPNQVERFVETEIIGASVEACKKLSDEMSAAPIGEQTDKQRNSNCYITKCNKCGQAVRVNMIPRHQKSGCTKWVQKVGNG
jgi:hypothetical protein